MAIKYAIGTLAQWNALTVGEQAEYAGHANDIIDWYNVYASGISFSDGVILEVIGDHTQSTAYSATDPQWNSNTLTIQSRGFEKYRINLSATTTPYIFKEDDSYGSFGFSFIYLRSIIIDGSDYGSNSIVIDRNFRFEAYDCEFIRTAKFTQHAGTNFSRLYFIRCSFKGDGFDALDAAGSNSGSIPLRIRLESCRIYDSVVGLNIEEGLNASQRFYLFLDFCSFFSCTSAISWDVTKTVTSDITLILRNILSINCSKSFEVISGLIDGVSSGDGHSCYDDCSDVSTQFGHSNMGANFSWSDVRNDVNILTDVISTNSNSEDFLRPVIGSILEDTETSPFYSTEADIQTSPILEIYPCGCLLATKIPIEDVLYVNLGIPATIKGDGSSADPFAKRQVNILYDLTYRYTSQIGITKFKGQVTFPSSSPYKSDDPSILVYWDYYAPATSGDIIQFTSWDKKTFGPPSWYNPEHMDNNRSDDFYIEMYPLKNATPCVFEDLVISQVGIEFDVYDSDSGVGPGDVSVKNCYFQISSYLLFIQYTLEARTFSFYGCTFVGSPADYVDGYPYLDVEGGGAGSTFRFYDCVFKGVPEFYNYQSLEFHNCYFSSMTFSDDETGYWGPIEDAVDGGVTSTTFVDCHFNYDFGDQSFPTALSATIELKEDFLFSNFNIPEESSPIVLQRWEENDYNTGLFGNTRKSVGAFYFPSDPVIDIPNKQTIVIYVDSAIGDDTNNNGSIVYPYQTLQHAYDELAEGGLIVLQNGDGSSYGNLSITKNMTIRGAYGASPRVGTLTISRAQCFVENVEFKNLSQGIVINR